MSIDISKEGYYFLGKVGVVPQCGLATAAHIFTTYDEFTKALKKIIVDHGKYEIRTMMGDSSDEDNEPNISFLLFKILGDSSCQIKQIINLPCIMKSGELMYKYNTLLVDPSYQDDDWEDENSEFAKELLHQNDNISDILKNYTEIKLDSEDDLNQDWDDDWDDSEDDSEDELEDKFKECTLYVDFSQLNNQNIKKYTKRNIPEKFELDGLTFYHGEFRDGFS